MNIIEYDLKNFMRKFSHFQINDLILFLGSYLGQKIGIFENLLAENAVKEC